jgi:hypothetical protein
MYIYWNGDRRRQQGVDGRHKAGHDGPRVDLAESGIIENRGQRHRVTVTVYLTPNAAMPSLMARLPVPRVRVIAGEERL